MRLLLSLLGKGLVLFPSESKLWEATAGVDMQQPFFYMQRQQPKSIQEKAELSHGENLSPWQLDLSPKSSLLCLDFVVRWA